MAFTPSEIGPGLWTGIHTFAGVAVTEKKRLGLKKLVYSLVDCFSCDDCSKHLAEGIREIQFEEYADSAETVLFWTYLLHDRVNRLHGKKSPSFAEVKRIYLITKKSECGGNCGVPSGLGHDVEGKPKRSKSAGVKRERKSPGMKPFKKEAVERPHSPSAKERRLHKQKIPVPGPRGKLQVNYGHGQREAVAQRVGTDEEGYDFRSSERLMDEDLSRLRSAGFGKPGTPKIRFLSVRG